jgi:2-phosphosulfolactate phosphatase
VVDVLSFSTAVSVAVDRGGIVIPHRTRDDATAAAVARATGARLASTDRRDPGPTLSPGSLGALRAGERLVLRSPNGATCSALAAEAGATVIAGCLRNAGAVARFIGAHGGSVAVIPAGERWVDGSLRPAVEDLIGAGAILHGLDRRAMSPEAMAAVAAFGHARAAIPAALAASVSGRELADAGFGDDVSIAAVVDATIVVPVLERGAFTGR